MEETVEIPLGGMDAFTDAKHVRPGKLAVLANGRFSSPPGISKRNGYLALTTETNNDLGSITQGVRLEYFADERLLFTNRQLFAYSAVLEKWVLKGSAGDVLMSRRPVYYDQSTDIPTCTLAVNAFLILNVWGRTQTNGGAFTASVTDFFGTVLATSTADYGVDARTFALGSYLYCVFLDGSVPNTFKVFRILANGAVDVTIPAGSDFAVPIDVVAAGAGRLFDARELERAAPDPTRRFILAYREEDGSGGYHIMVRLFDDAFPPVQIWERVIDEYPGRLLTVLGREGEQVYVAWDGDGELIDGNVIRCAVLNVTTGAITAGPTQVNTGQPDSTINRGSFIRHSATQALLVWEVSKRRPFFPPPPPSQFLPHTRWRRIGNDSVGVGDETFAYDCALVTRPWSDGGRYFIGVVFHELEQSAGFVLEIGNGTDGQLSPRWAGTFGRLTASGFLWSDAEWTDGIFGFNNVVSNAHELFPNTSTYAFGSIHKHKFSKNRTAVLIDGGSGGRDLRDEIRFHRGMHMTVVDHANACRYQGAPWQRGYFVAGGKPGWYDRYQLTEHGFAWYPSYDRDKNDDEALDDLSATGSGLLGPGTFQVCAIFEHEDASGMLTRSGVSRIMSLTTALNDRTLIVERTTALLSDRVPVAWWMSGFSRPREVYFRTIADGTDFFRAKPFAGSAIITNPIDLTPEVVTFAPTTAPEEDDAAIEDNELLYTTGDILANDGTPPCRFACVHGDRLWIGGLENPQEMWFSQPLVENETPRFNGNLRIWFDRPILNARSMDDKLCCFASDRIYIVTGRGPSAAGGADIGFEINLVTSDVGILEFASTEMRSLVETPLGLMFRSSKGIYLLERGLGVKFVGREVSSLIDTSYTCVGACVKQDTNEVYFAFTPLVEFNSLLLIYNYLLDVWYVDTLNYRAASICAIPSLTEHRIALLNENGVVYETDTAGYADVNIGGTIDAFITLRVELPWIKPAEILQGWCELKEIMLLGSASGVDVDFQLRVQVFYDYNEDTSNPATFDDVVFTEAQIDALTENVPLSRFQLSFSPRIQQCQALKIKITDEDSGDGPDQGYALHSVVLKFTRRPGTAHTHAGARQ